MPRHTEQFTLGDGRGVAVTYDTPCPEGCTCPLHDDPTNLEAREFTDAHRVKLAKSGAAMKDGSFPIVTAGDLANAIKAHGRATDPAAAKAHIITRAKALGLTSTLPEGWGSQQAQSPEEREETAEDELDDAAIARVRESHPELFDQARQELAKELSFQAAAGRLYASDLPHPNRAPFKAVLHQVDQPSDKPPSVPNGKGGHRVMIPRAVAERRLHTLVGMGLDMNADLDGHQVKRKIGVITHASLGTDPAPDMQVPGFTPDANAVNIAGWLYEKDFPREVAQLRAAARKGTLGTSYEVEHANVRDPNAPVWVLDDLTYTGAAALSRDAAAYTNTRLAAQHTEDFMPDPVNPTPAPAPTPTDDMEARIAAAVEKAIAPLRAEMSARFQAVESAVNKQNVKPGESPEELQLRDQANAMDTEASALEPQATAKREEATQLRSAGKVDEATKADEAAEEIGCKASTMHAAAAQLRAKAYGFAPVIHAVGVEVGARVTDAVAPIGKLVTELQKDVASLKGLATDKGFPSIPGAGGPVAQPPRASTRLEAGSWASKFTDGGTKGLTEYELDQKLAAEGRSIEDRIRIKNEIAGLGLLRQ